MRLNRQQQIAVEELDRSMSISAGAGSGKTTVLVERFWTLIEKGRARVDQILAITFTRKAAWELIDRVRKRIDESGWEQDQKTNLMEKMSRAYIGTIHSFCARLLKENPVEAGVDPYFRVIEEIEGEQLLQQIIKEVVLDEISQGTPDVLGLIELFGYNQLNLELQTLIRTLTNKGLKINQVEKTTWYSLTTEEQQTSLRMAKIKEALQAVAQSLPQIDSKSKTYLAVQEIADNYQQWVAVLDRPGMDLDRNVAELCSHLQGVCKQIKSRVVKDDVEILKQTLAELTGFQTDKNTVPKLKAMFKLLQKIADSFQVAKDKQNLLEFSDLEEKTVAMLKSHRAILNRYQSQFRHIMVDEFQDTNFRQVELINLLADGKRESKLFLVGDAKQSIYRFRGAEVSLFRYASQQIKESGGLRHTLDENYRTREQVITIINNLFAELMQHETGYLFEQLIPRRENNLTPPQTEIHLIKQDNSSELGRDEAEAECLARRINELINGDELMVAEMRGGQEVLRPAQYGDIALLFRTTRNMHAFANVFANYQIPSYIVGSRGFYQTEEVAAILLALQVIDNRGNELAWTGMLRSSMFGVSDETLWLMKHNASTLEDAVARIEQIPQITPTERAKVHMAGNIIFTLRGLKNRFSLSELIDLLITQSGFEYALATRPNGQQMIANLNKLKRLVVSYRRNYSHFSDFLEYIEQVQEDDSREPEAATENENGNTVKMMTIHQAKGLEFPVVIIPETHRQFNFRDISGISVLSDQYGLFIKEDQKGLLREKAEAAEKIKLEEEYKRLLYVAMTRARDYLILSGYYRIDSKGMVMAASNSWLNWLFDSWRVKEEDFTALEQAGFKVFNYDQGDITTDNRLFTSSSPIRCEREIDKDQVSTVVAAIKEHPYRRLISATAVMDYSFCQRYYYLKYRMGIPEIKLGEENAGETTAPKVPAAKIGTLVHRAIEEGENLKAAQEVLRQLMQGVVLEEEDEGLLEELDHMLVGYYHNKAISDLLNHHQVEKEVEFIARFDQNTYIKGYLDQLIYDQNEAVLIDLKTSLVNSTSQLEKKTRQYSIQLSVYEEALRRILGLKKVTKKLFFLRKGQLIDGLTTRIELDLSGDAPTASPDECEKCVYNSICRRDEEDLVKNRK
ncbi:MAG: UvrD-helicase domain-containing protein [Syntrophomonadaceae bacterium]|jgi:ATP-dependent helicase/nuclease subunit A